MNVIIGSVNSEIGSTIASSLAQDPKNSVITTARSDRRYSISNTIEIDNIDLTMQAHCNKVAAIIDNQFISYFSYIHAAGDFWNHKRLIDTEYNEIVDMMNSHWLSFVQISKALIPLMMKKGGGRFITFSCNSVGYCYPDMLPFTSSKAALECSVKIISNEYMRHNISALAISLPTILTDRVKQEKPNGDHANYLTIDEVSSFVVNDVLPANPHCTGTILKIVKYSPTFYNDGYYERNPIASKQ